MYGDALAAELQSRKMHELGGAVLIAFHTNFLTNALAKQSAPYPLPGNPVWHWVYTNHQNNCLLWDEEDLARRCLVSDAAIAVNKRAIDVYNQARNDATEKLDECLLRDLGLADSSTANTFESVPEDTPKPRLNSETAGSMVDRLSILALKIHAMELQTQRLDVDLVHRQTAIDKLSRLKEQQTDLAACLDALLADCRTGAAYFKVYRQFKMYNDPQYNPVLVAERTSSLNK